MKLFTVTFADQPGHVDNGQINDDGSVIVYCPNYPFAGYPYDNEAAMRVAADAIGGVVHMEDEVSAPGVLRQFVIKYRNGDHEECGVQFPNGHVAATCEHMDKPLTFANLGVLEQRFKAIYPTDPGAYSIEWVA